MGEAVGPWPPKEGPSAPEMLPDQKCLEKGQGFLYANEMAPQHQQCLRKPKVGGKDI